jgi:hypothetical protein
MATAVDPVRRTLDTLALDPNAATDRPYLESMLRRLGYSDAEIRAALQGTPAGAGPASTTSTAAPDNEDRLIEIEYTGLGQREFLVVVGVDESEMATDPLGLGTGMEAGTEVFEGGPSMEEVDRLVAEGGGDFDDWGGEAGGGTMEDAAGAGEAPPEGEGAPEQLAEGGTPAGEAGKPAPTGPDYQLGETMVDFKEASVNEARIEPIDPAAEADKLRAEGWAVADPETGEFPPEPVPAETWEAGAEPAAEAPAAVGDETWEAPETGYQYGDWTLYRRDEMRGGEPQRVYFFSKGTPEGGVPAAIPEGYVVAENPDTGRPYLRQATGTEYSPEGIDTAHPSADPRAGAGGKKRVRIMRVRAATREEAIAKMQAEGRNVIASMPIDIEKKLR